MRVQTHLMLNGERNKPIEGTLKIFTFIWILNWLQILSMILLDRKLKATAYPGEDNQEKRRKSGGKMS